ncbi:hypothetical protein GGQ85_003788 [Nitrobacter vulgaris]|nr:hypothetical protein [Nitrobacter vulgaris]
MERTSYASSSFKWTLSLGIDESLYSPGHPLPKVASPSMEGGRHKTRRAWGAAPGAPDNRGNGAATRDNEIENPRRTPILPTLMLRRWEARARFLRGHCLGYELAEPLF